MFVLAYNNKEGDDKVSVDSLKKYFLPRFKIEKYNTEIDGKIKATEADTRTIIYYILEKSKETILEFSKRTTKVL